MEKINVLGYPIFDSHAHYDDKSFKENLLPLAQEMKQNGVTHVINCGIDYASSKACIELSKKVDYFYTAVGVHPENLYKDATLDAQRLIALSNYEKVVAIGEIGLDYYWDNFPRDMQKKWFEEQILLAKLLDLPVIVHDREAHADTLDILKKHKPKGVVHCFSGSAEMAKEILKLGMYIGIGGVITFKNARKLLEVAEILPMDKILLETDAPYLSPVPFRGKQCRSDYIYFVAEKIAEIKNLTVKEVLEITSQNSKNLFGIK